MQFEDINQEKLKELRNDFLNKTRTKTNIAEYYGVSPRTIGRWFAKLVTVELGNISTQNAPYMITDITIDRSNAVPAEIESSEQDPLENVDWSEVPYIITNEYVVIVVNDEETQVKNDVPEFNDIVNNLISGNIKEAYLLCDVSKAIEQYTFGNIVYENDVFKYKGFPIEHECLNIIRERFQVGDSESCKSTLAFLDKLFMNPSSRSVKGLYRFLEHHDIEITDDGMVKAWKYVDSDYMDSHSRTFNNSVGKTVSMPRNQVNDNDKEICSFGLHVGSKSYMPYSSSKKKVLRVLVHPKDVVSCPHYSQAQKLRVCSYKVVEDVTEEFCLGIQQ